MPVVDLWNVNRPVQNSAEAMISPDRTFLSASIREEVICRSTPVAVEVVNRAMGSIGSTLDCNVDRRPGRLALLSIKCVCLDFEFLYGVGRW
jgi:hypothetical protein